MSWDTDWDRLEQSPCACGNGIVVRREYSESNDWNQTRGGYYGEEIQCDNCSKKYRIERIIKHYPAPSWKGDGISRKEYLVPHNMIFPHNVEARELIFTQLDERIVASFRKEQLEEIIDDMIANKFSTRLKLSEGHQIVQMYQRRYKKRGLPQIIDYLKSCVRNYDTYQWTFLKIQEYEENERVRAAKDKKILDDVLSKSYELKFRYVKED